MPRSVHNLKVYRSRHAPGARGRKERMMGRTLGSWARTAAGSSAIVLVAGAAFAAEPVKTVTFTKDVAPIFQNKCESCHRADGMAPMSLVTYEGARPWAKSIAARIGARQMPPWHIDKTVGIQKFKNDRSLSDEQIETILA